MRPLNVPTKSATKSATNSAYVKSKVDECKALAGGVFVYNRQNCLNVSGVIRLTTRATSGIPEGLDGTLAGRCSLTLSKPRWKCLELSS
jgi:hypothetical protein